MSITIKDVALKAGVSTATVSHVMNGSRVVRPDTKQRVLEAISALNYYPNVAARTFKTGKNNTIGFIVPDIGTGFFSSIIEEIEMLLAENNYKLLIVNTKRRPETELESIRLLCAGLVDGIIVASSIDDFMQIKNVLPKNDSTPFIFLEQNITNCPYDSIMISDYNATIACMDSLIAKGHTKIGFITGTTYLSSAKERFEAYTSQLNSHGLPYLPHLVQDGDARGFLAIETLIGYGVTAIIASTNNITNDALAYFVNQNISVVNQIALAGFINDNFTSKSLTNIFQVLHPVQEMGALAVKQLFRRMENPEIPTKNIVLMGTFLEPANLKPCKIFKSD